MAKSRKLKSKAVTIAPGKRYYGPPELRPSTKYKRGGSVAQYLEKGGTLNERKKRDRRDPIKSKEIKLGHKGFIDIERAKFQMAKEAKAKQTEKEALAQEEVEEPKPGVAPEVETPGIETPTQKREGLYTQATDFVSNKLFKATTGFTYNEQLTASGGIEPNIISEEDAIKAISLAVAGGYAWQYGGKLYNYLKLPPNKAWKTTPFAPDRPLSRGEIAYLDYWRSGGPAVNPKTIGLMESMLSKTFSLKTLATLTALGLGIGALGSITFASFWGRAETPEPISITGQKIYEQAKWADSKEAWALWFETKAAGDEYYNTLANPGFWDWFPNIGATKNAITKFEGGRKGWNLLTKSADLEYKNWLSKKEDIDIDINKKTEGDEFK